MKNAEPAFRIDFEDGTSGNFIKVAPIPSGKRLLENISGMKYGRKDTEAHTLDILKALKKKRFESQAITPKIISAAEAVIADYYTSRNKTFLLYDIERDEYIVYIVEERAHVSNYAVRVTRMIRSIINNHDLKEKDLFVDATFDYPSLIKNLKFEMELEAEIENYESAARFRDIVVGLEEKIKEHNNMNRGTNG